MKIGDIDHSYKNIRETVIEELKNTGKSNFQSEIIRKNKSTIPVQIFVSMIEYESEQLIFANILPANYK